jgi:hypothetical protein
VSQAIVDHQTQFLDLGPEHIEPLKMQQIADKVGVHVTTVSRAVDDKWIQTPRGIFPLKRFFGGGTTNSSGEEIAWDAVRLKLQEIVDGENKEHPFSDDELVKELAKHGLTVARRTVTKYRKAMSIRSSRERKDWSAAGHGEDNGRQQAAAHEATKHEVTATETTTPEAPEVPVDEQSSQSTAENGAILPPTSEHDSTAAADEQPTSASHSPGHSVPRTPLPVAKSIFPE